MQRLEVSGAVRPICGSFFGWLYLATHHQRAHSSRPTPSCTRTPYAAFVKEIINSIAPEDGRIGSKHVELK